MIGAYVLNQLLHLGARVALRVAAPLRAKRIVDAAGRFLRPLSSEEASRVASQLERRRGTCLSRSLAVAARLPSSEVVIGSAMVPGQPFSAHAWVECDGKAIGTTLGQREIARFR